MTFDQAIAELRLLSEREVSRMVDQYAHESGVTREQWLTKCTVDVSYRLEPGLSGEEVVLTCKARKR